MHRHLLFAALAVKKGFVSSNDLAAGLNVWLQQPDRPLAEVLCQLDWLDAAQIRTLESLVDLQAAEFETLATQGPVATASWPDKPSIETTAYLGERSPVVTGGGSPRYRVLRLHARGGLGEVFVAQDQELGREVALKEIQARVAGSPEARDRFVRDAE